MPFEKLITPFWVSSFSSLIKGKGFVLVIPPSTSELLVAIAVCAVFEALVVTRKWMNKNQAV